ncbi:MAG: Abi-alpha family protein [Patescibacteria group bacterium]
MSDLTPQDPITTAIKESAKIAEKFLGQLVNPALEEGGGMLSDTVKFWRFKNQINLVLKAKSFLENKGITPNKVLPKTLLPIIENGSLEEDEGMKDRWSAMLANAADPNSNSIIRPGYPDILKQLSPLEIKILDTFYDQVKDKPKDEQDKTGIIKEKVIKFAGVSGDEYDILVGNLFRLGLCQTPSSKGGTTIGNYPLVLRTYDFIELTPMGIDFIKACRY